MPQNLHLLYLKQQCMVDQDDSEAKGWYGQLNNYLNLVGLVFRQCDLNVMMRYKALVIILCFVA